MNKRTRKNPTQLADFRGLNDWIEVFAAGTHTAANGQAMTFSAADLDQMVANVSLGKPPAVIGHPTHDSPAYAWATLRRDGDKLLAKFEDVNKDFAAAVESGAYRNRSVRVYQDSQHGWRVDHIGWLGAQRPAIAGLKPLEYKAPESPVVLDFSSQMGFEVSWALNGMADMMSGLRDWLIEKEGLETANTLLPSYRIDMLKDASNAVRQSAIDEDRIDEGVGGSGGGAPAAAAFNAPTGLTQADIDAAVQLATNKLRADFNSAHRAQQVAAWVDAGKVLPAEKDGLLSFMGVIDAAVVADFSAAGGAKTPAEFFAAFMAARPPVLKLGQHRATPENDPGAAMGGAGLSPQDIAKQAKDFMASQAAAGVELSFVAAVDHVSQLQKAGHTA